jgi:hypothetical protein
LIILCSGCELVKIILQKIGDVKYIKFNRPIEKQINNLPINQSANLPIGQSANQD